MLRRVRRLGRNRWRWLLVACLALSWGAPASLHAEVVRDGSIGPGPEVQPVPLGGHFELTEAMGDSRGTNLFHSLWRLDLEESESAAFTLEADSLVENIFARVTGGRSQIDGRLGAEANLFLLNPHGLIFGPQASLDVQGSFYGSTAHVVEFRLSDGGTASFDARAGGALSGFSSLAVAQPDAFGFLAAPETIEVRRSALRLESGGTLALIGGDLAVEGGPQGVLRSFGGDVALVSVRSAGRVTGLFAGSDSGPVLEGFSRLGDIRLSSGAVVSSSAFELSDLVDLGIARITEDGRIESTFSDLFSADFVRAASVDEPGEADVVLAPPAGDGGRFAVIRPTGRDESSGRIFVRGGALLVEDSDLRATSFGTVPGGITVGLERELVIRKRQPSGASNVGLLARTGDVVKMVRGELEGFLLVDGRFVAIPDDYQVVLGGAGDGGSIQVDAGDVLIDSGGRISATSLGSGRGGEITLGRPDQRAGSLLFAGRDNDAGGTPSGLFSNAQGVGDAGSIQIWADELRLRDGGAVIAQTTGDGRGGDIRVDVDRLEISSGSQIDSSTSAQSLAENEPGPTTGDGGSLRILAHESVHLRGRLSGENFGQLSTGSQRKSVGSAGSIRVETPQLRLDDGAGISVTTRGGGSGGEIRILADHISLAGGSRISAESTASGGGVLPLGVDQPGDAGKIVILPRQPGSTDFMLEIRSSEISTNAAGAGGGSIAIDGEGIRLDESGGRPILVAQKRLDPDDPDSLVDKPSGSTDPGRIVLAEGRISTSVGSGDATAGNILIDPELLAIDAQSRIQANAAGGRAGNVLLVAATTLLGAPLDDLVQAQSERGVQGQIDLRSPEVDLLGRIDPEAAEIVDPADLLHERCGIRQARRVGGQFFVKPSAGLRLGPHGFLPARSDAK